MKNISFVLGLFVLSAIFMTGLIYAQGLVTPIFDQGMRLYAQKDYAGAADYLGQVCEMTPDHQQARFYLVYCLIASKNYQKALSHVEILCGKNPTNTQYSNLKNQIQLAIRAGNAVTTGTNRLPIPAKGAADKTKPVVKTAREPSKPTSTGEAVSSTLSETGIEIAKAVDLPSDTAGSETSSIKPHETVMLTKTSPVPEKTTHYELSSLTANDAKDLYRIAMAYLEDGAVLSAIQTFLDLAKAAPTNTDVLSKTGILIMENGESCLQEGRDLLLKLKELKKDQLSDDENIAYARSLFLVEPLKFEDAEKILKSVLDKNAKNLPAVTAMGDLNLIWAKYDKALEWYTKAKETASADKRAHWGIGYALKGMGKGKEAMHAFEQAYALDTKDATNNVKMGKVMLDMKQPLAASRHFNLALEIDPNHLGAHLALIPMLLANNCDMTARSHLEKVLKMDPKNPQVYLYEGIFHEMRGNLPEAVNNYETAASFGAQGVEAKLRLARIYAGIGHSFPGNPFSNENPMDLREYRLFYDAERALSLLKEVHALAPKHPDNGFITDTIDKLESHLVRWN